MAIYHLSVKTVSRSDGRSATAAAAYRAGAQIVDERTGEVHDYRRKKGIVSATLFVPEDAPGWASERAELWNKAEESEKRKNSTVAREFEVALPEELTTAQRQELAHALAVELVKHHGCAVDVAVHEPGKEGDTRNHHAHILCTTRRLGPSGFGDKTRELDDRATGAAEVARWRERWAELANAALAKAGHEARIDHRTLKAQGIDREPTEHLGPSATAIERRGQTSQKTLNQAERLSAAAAPRPAAVPAPPQPQPQVVRRPVEPPKQPEAPIPSPAPKKSLVERLAASWAAMLEWIKGIGGAQEPVQPAGLYIGPVKHIDDLHCIQKTGKRYAVHRLADLDAVPALDDPKMEIQYRDGKGRVSGARLAHGLER